MFWTDTHAHLYHEDFQPDLDKTMARIGEAGIGRIFMPNVDSKSIDAMLAMEARFPSLCTAMMGLHPCSVTPDFENELRTVERWLGSRTFAAVGEIGTDLFWDRSFWEQQQEAFRIQVGWARDRRLPLVIHCRDSMNETLELLEPLAGDGLTGIFHCFTGTVDQAKRITEMGFYLGIGGVVTFKNGGLDKIMPQIDIRHIVLETDSPYLAPAPYRGKRNEPSYIPLIAKKIMDLTGISSDELRSVTTRNADKIFDTAKRTVH